MVGCGYLRKSESPYNERLHVSSSLQLYEAYRKGVQLSSEEKSGEKYFALKENHPLPPPSIQPRYGSVVPSAGVCVRECFLYIKCIYMARYVTAESHPLCYVQSGQGARAGRVLGLSELK